MCLSIEQLLWEVQANHAAQLILLLSLKRDRDTRALTLVLHHWLFLTEFSSLVSFSKICVNYLAPCSHMPSYLKLSQNVKLPLLYVFTSVFKS